jgi:hypothetical protein
VSGRKTTVSFYGKTEDDVRCDEGLTAEVKIRGFWEDLSSFPVLKE